MSTTALASGYVARSRIGGAYLTSSGTLSARLADARLFPTQDEARAAESLGGTLELEGRTVHAATAEDLGLTFPEARPMARLEAVRKLARETSREAAARRRLAVIEDDKRHVLDMIRERGRAQSEDLKREAGVSEARFYAALGRLKAERRAESYRIGHKVYWTLEVAG